MNALHQNFVKMMVPEFLGDEDMSGESCHTTHLDMLSDDRIGQMSTIAGLGVETWAVVLHELPTKPPIDA